MADYMYSISPEVFAKYPGYVRGVVLAYDVVNGESPAELIALMRTAEEQLRVNLKLEGLAEHPRFRSWREAFRAFGAKPSEFRPSIEALVRRVLHGDPLPSINTLVDLGNLVSIQCLVPTGGHAIDRLNGDITLCPAFGDEVFVPFGSDQPEAPLKGEIIFTEGKTVLTRRWAWRQSNHTLTLPSTTAIEFNVDGLPPVPVEEVEQVCELLSGLVTRFCGGKIRWELLTAEHPALNLAP